MSRRQSVRIPFYWAVIAAGLAVLCLPAKAQCTKTVPYSFCPVDCSDGTVPSAGLVEDSKGNGDGFYKPSYER